jgi:hypothetical protein
MVYADKEKQLEYMRQYAAERRKLIKSSVVIDTKIEQIELKKANDIIKVGYLYQLVCNDLSITDTYIGSTICFKQRKSHHKRSCCNINAQNYNANVYQFIRNNGGWNNWRMILIETYSCSNRLELEKRERFWIETMKSTLNKVIPGHYKEELINKLNQPLEINNDYYMNLLMWKHKIKTPHNELIRRMYEPRHRYEMKIILHELYENWL